LEILKVTLLFQHGGAWGSGQTWQYRLVAQPFLDQGMAVAVVGYRTFPDGDMNDQVQDLEMAAQKLTQQYPELCTKESELGVCVMGHSSGAHIGMSMLVNRLKCKLQQPERQPDKDTMRIDCFCGLSAPYEISSHFEFETGRGLEQLSPMLAACGYDEERLSEYSPVLNLFREMIRRPQYVCEQVNDICPRMALIHGDQDETVPLSSTRQAAQLLSLAGITKCDDIYLTETGHSETVLELMFGGKTQDVVMEWLLKSKTVNVLEATSIRGQQIFSGQPEASMVV
jgi:acetyl esterase/lipase